MADFLSFLGLGTQAEKFAYGRDDRFGVMASEKIPSTWVNRSAGQYHRRL